MYITFKQAKRIARIDPYMDSNMLYVVPEGECLPQLMTKEWYYTCCVRNERFYKESKKFFAYTIDYVLDWLREKHDVDINVCRSFSMTDSYHYEVIVDRDYDNIEQQDCVANRPYWQSQLDAIDCALKILETKALRSQKVLNFLNEHSVKPASDNRLKTYVKQIGEIVRNRMKELDINEDRLRNMCHFTPYKTKRILQDEFYFRLSDIAELEEALDINIFQQLKYD